MDIKPKCKLCHKYELVYNTFKYKFDIDNLFKLFDGYQQVLAVLEYDLLLTPRRLSAADSNSRGRGVEGKHASNWYLHVMHKTNRRPQREKILRV